MKEYLNKITFSVLRRLLNESGGSEIHVFDFDDTLVKTSGRIRVIGGDGKEFFLTPMQYAKYIPQPGDEFDYSEFDTVNDPVPVDAMMLNLRMAIRNLGTDNVFILTARGNPAPVRDFLRSQGIPDIGIFAVGSSDPQKKADVIENIVLSRKIKNVHFYDDSTKNIRAVNALKNDLPNVSIKTITVRV